MGLTPSWVIIDWLLLRCITACKHFKEGSGKGQHQLTENARDSQEMCETWQGCYLKV